MIKPNLFSSSDYHIKNLSERMLGEYDEIALANGLITPELLALHKQLTIEASNYAKARIKDATTLNTIRGEIRALDNEQNKKLSDYVATRAIVLNAVKGFESALTIATAKERFEDFIDETIKLLEKRKISPQLAVQNIKEAKKDLKIKLTSTVHPTVFLTVNSIDFQRKLTHHAESIAGYVKQGTLVSEDSYRIMSDQIREFVSQIANNSRTITHNEAVTIEEERGVDRTNFGYIADFQNETVNDWNETIKSKSAALIEAGYATEQDIAELIFHENELPFDNRTWVDADADGREKTDSISTARVIEQNFKSKRKLDWRQNAKVHETLVGALFQVEFRHNADFASFCRKFVEKLNIQGNGWLNPSRSIYQQLGKHKSAFLRNVLASDYKLVPEDITAHAVPFTTKYWELFDEFVKNEKRLNDNLPSTVTFSGLAKFPDYSGEFLNLQNKFMQIVKDTDIEFNLRGKHVKWKFAIHENGFNYVQTDERGRPRFFKDCRKTKVVTDAEGVKTLQKVAIEPEERDIIMDTLRKLEIIRNAIKEKGRDVVGDRYEIANFSSAENFYEVMLLFKEAGIIKVENGLVTQADLGIVPLLETVEDLKNAEKIYKELLEDPLALSYFRARGNKITIMVGFSDGAKSGGDFASELYAIPAATERLASILKAKGIDVEFKEGRGNNLNRGGMSEAGAALAEHPDNVAISGKHSATIQSDEPLEYANSPTMGRDQMRSLFIGTMAARISANTRTPEQKEVIELAKEAIEFIARVSSSNFRSLVRENPETTKFLNKIPYNKLASSRAAKRGASAPDDYEGMRAVPVALRFATAKCPANSVGLKEALQAFMSGADITIKEENAHGKIEDVTINSRQLLDKLLPHAANSHLPEGQRALEVLKRHPGFAAFMRKTEINLQKNFDPVIATEWGKKTGCEAYANALIESNNGLLDIIQTTLRRLPTGNRFKDTSSLAEDAREADSIVSMAICLESKKLSPDNPNERPGIIALNNALMVVSGSDMRPDAAPRMRDLPNLLLAA